jgi:hypothetical protein
MKLSQVVKLLVGPKREYNKWLRVIGIILLLIGFFVAAYSYRMDRNCISIYEQVKSFNKLGSISSCPSYYYLYGIIGGATAALIGVFLVIIPSKGGSELRHLSQLAPIIILAAVGLIAVISLTEMEQYVPVSDREEDSNPNSNLSIRLIRDSTILIPFRSVFPQFAVKPNLTAVIEFRPPIINITNVKLTGPTNTILTYHGDFINTKFLPAYKNKTLPAWQSTWAFKVSAQHDMTVDNSSNVYNLDISYINSTDWKSNHVSVAFAWPIKTLNLSNLTYFWIVLIGVIVSKLSSDFLERPHQLDNQSLLRLYLGIGFSAIIALLIFANFQREVKMTGDILINISLAFGFGFGFDKVLEAGQKYLANQKPEQK